MRDIHAAILPRYQAKSDTLEFNMDYEIGPALTLTSQTGYNQDFLSSTEDYNRFDTTPGLFLQTPSPGAPSCGPGAPPACFETDPNTLYELEGTGAETFEDVYRIVV